MKPDSITRIRSRVTRSNYCSINWMRIRSLNSPSHDCPNSLHEALWDFHTVGNFAMVRHRSPRVDNRISRTCVPADYVMAHAVWRLDQKWDAEGVAHDNPIEKRLVPSLVRLSYRNPQSRWFANELGGSTIDEFDRRQQQDADSFEPSEDYSQNEFIQGQYVLRAFWQNVNAVGPVGEEFRSVRSEAALQLANKMLEHSHMLTSMPTWMDFLFLNVKGREPLARDFLKSFQAKLAANKHMQDWTLKLNWSYLARMRPLPKAHEFIALFPTQAKSSLEFGNPDQSLVTSSRRSQTRDRSRMPGFGGTEQSDSRPQIPSLPGNASN